ncbi:MAG: acyltransferase [Alistipes sp.]
MNRSPNKMTRIPSLYLLRCVCMFMIVMIHYPIAGANDCLPILRAAVPAFFMTSGYFLFTAQREEMKTHLIKACRKMVWLILYANVIYFLLKLVLYLAAPASNFLPLTTFSDWVNVIFTGSVMLEYLWYLTAYLETLAVFLILLHFRLEKILFRLVPLLILMGLLVGKYSFLIGLPEALPLAVSRNFLTIGLPCFAVGYFIACHEQQILQKIGRALPVLSMLLVVAAWGEGRLLACVGRLGDLFILSLPLATALFLLCLQHKQFASHTVLARIGEQHALNIYLFQAVVAGLVVGIFAHFFGINITPYVAPLTFVGSLLLSVVINGARERLIGFTKK